MSLKTWSDDHEGVRPWIYRLACEYGSIGAVADALMVNRMTVYEWTHHPEKISVKYLRQFLRGGLITSQEIMKIIEPKEEHDGIQK